MKNYYYGQRLYELQSFVAGTAAPDTQSSCLDPHPCFLFSVLYGYY